MNRMLKKGEVAPLGRRDAPDARGGRGGGPHPAALGRRRPRRARGCSTRRPASRAPTRSSSPATTIDPVALLERTFEETDGYDEIVLLRDIRLESHCEHHMVPIIGRAHVAYLPRPARGRHQQAGARGRRLSPSGCRSRRSSRRRSPTPSSEVLQPRGVAVVIEAAHQCMTTRGVHKPGVDHGDQPHAGRLPRRWRDAARVPGDDRPQVRLVQEFSWPEKSSTLSRCCVASWRSTPPRATPTSR